MLHHSTSDKGFDVIISLPTTTTKYSNSAYLAQGNNLFLLPYRFGMNGV